MADRKYMEETRYSGIVLLNVGQRTDTVNSRDMNCAGEQPYCWASNYNTASLSHGKKCTLSNTLLIISGTADDDDDDDDTGTQMCTAVPAHTKGVRMGIDRSSTTKEVKQRR
jgi:hypothetical protein